MTKKTEAKSVPAKKAAKTAKTTTKKSVPAKKKLASKPSSQPAKKRVPAKKSVKKSVPAAKKRVPAEKPGHGIDLVRRCVKALDDKKAQKIEVIKLGEKSSVADYFVIASGTSDTHLRALRVELEKAIDAVVPAGTVRVQNERGSGWCCVDAFDVVIHIFSEEKREFYNLEELYSQGEKIEISF